MSTGHSDVPQDVQIHVDASNQTVRFSQKASRFDLKPQTVVIPIVAIEALYVNLLTASLRTRGVQIGAQQMNVAAPKTGAVPSA